ncbi:MAG: hypothetical protein ACKO63_06850 [Nodosilinea sp.]
MDISPVTLPKLPIADHLLRSSLPFITETSGGGVVSTDYSLVPGQRVGPVTATTSRAQLAQIYGEAVLRDELVPVGEGFTEPGTLVNPGTDQQFTILWLDQERHRPLLAKDFGPAWKTPEGIGLGMAYGDLQQVLGRFQVYGFEWDYGGSVSLQGSHLEAYYGELILRLSADPSAIAQHPQAYQAVMGDRLFSSEDPHLAVLDLTVTSMLVYLNKPAQ